MWKTIVSYLPEWQVFIQAFIVFFIPNLISKLFNRFATQRMSDENESLSLVQFQVGKQSKKDLVVAYIKDIVDPELVQEVENRIKKIDIDSVPESGYVEQLIEDNHLSPGLGSYNGNGQFGRNNP